MYKHHMSLCLEENTASITTMAISSFLIDLDLSGEAVAGLEGPLELCLSLEQYTQNPSNLPRCQLPYSSVFRPKRRSSTAGKLTLPPNQMLPLPLNCLSSWQLFFQHLVEQPQHHPQKRWRLGQPLLPGKET